MKSIDSEVTCYEIIDVVAKTYDYRHNHMFIVVNDQCY